MNDRRGIVLFLLVLFTLVLTTQRVSAQSGKTVVVQQRDAVITLLQNGDAQFVETWVVDFQHSFGQPLFIR